ncbi:MAG TPA: hypothetical protein VGM81_16505 [Burkholderiaceae bacterium]|jgi:hypothetical protein
MTSIDPSSALARLLRSPVRDGRAAGTAGSARGGETVNAPRAQPRDLSQVLASRVQALDPDDAFRRTKVLRLFIEHALLAEFGESLMADPGFFRMVDHVVAQMDNTPELSGHINRAVELLLQQR